MSLQDKESTSLATVDEVLSRIVDREVYTSCWDLVEVYVSHYLWDKGCGNSSDYDTFLSAVSATRLEDRVSITQELDSLALEELTLLDAPELYDDVDLEKRLSEIQERKEELEDPDYLNDCCNEVMQYWIISDWLGKHRLLGEISEKYSAVPPVFMIGSLYIWAQKSSSISDDAWLAELAKRISV